MCQLILKELDGIKHQNYVHKINQSKKIIFKQLKELAPPQKFQQHYHQINSMLNNMDWFNGDYGVDQLLFHSYSLISNSQSTFNELKYIYRDYNVGTEVHNWNYVNFQKYQQKYGTTIGYQYILIRQNYMLLFLWHNPKVRHIIATWLQDCLNLKHNFGVEIKSNANAETHPQNHLIQLLKGYNTQQTMYLPSFKRRPKETLTMTQWFNNMHEYAEYVKSFWD